MSSNQDLWKILTGQSSLREPELVQAEICSDKALAKLGHGIGHYTPPSAKSAGELKKQVKGHHLEFVLCVSEVLGLDQCQSNEIYELFLSGVYRGSLTELGQEMGDDKRRGVLLNSVRSFYHSERTHLLRCVHHLLSYWQDSSHPYQDVYRVCVEAMDPKARGLIIKGVWDQYRTCIKVSTPAHVTGEHDESVWVIQSLREQVLLLETVLLYYKDYQHPPTTLLHTVLIMQEQGFGSRQTNRVSLIPGAQPIIQHINHLCALILVEAVDLDYVYQYMTDHSKLQSHHLKDPSATAIVKSIDEQLSKWGDMQCHAPFLLSWMLLQYTTQSTDSEHYQILGNQALQCGVFDYLLSILDSPSFTGSMPLASLGKALVHTLLSVAISCFSETSLGDPATLIAIATKTLTHPRLQLEFWEEYGGDCTRGVGVLLSTALDNFPLETPFQLLITLSSHAHTAHSLTAHLHNLHSLTLALDHRWRVAYRGHDLVLLEEVTVFEQEARCVGGAPLYLSAGTRGAPLSAGGQRSDTVRWEVDCSALQVFAFLTASLLSLPGVGVDSTQHPLVAMVTDIARLVTVILSSDWTLNEHFQPITSQYFTIIQKYSSLPQLPTQLIAATLKCIAVMLRNNPSHVWERLGRTGFLPYISGPVTSYDSVPVAPGHYGHILNTWERSRGVYAVTMAMLDLLLGLYEDSVAMDTEGVLACVVWVCREVMSTCQGWRHTSRGSRDELAHQLLVLCHTILKTPTSGHVGTYISHYLLHSHGHRTLVSTLSLGVGVVNRLLSNQQGPPPVQVESLKLAFQIIATLLNNPSEEPTALEHALTTQSLKLDTPTSGRGTSLVHLVSVIASYIDHHGDPHVPIGATKLLTRLSLVSPMSVFACLGGGATLARDAFIGRLQSRVEEVELKVCVLELVRVCVQCQPGMAELFLCVRPSSTEAGGYTFNQSSCLKAVLEIIASATKQSKGPCPTVLHEAALCLLVSLWEGRHDAALIALRSTKDFWSHLTAPLSTPPLSWRGGGGVRVVAAVMRIVTMETYSTDTKSQLDKDLRDVVAGLGVKVESWIEMLSCEDSGLLEFCRALSALLLVLSASPKTKETFQLPSLRSSILNKLIISLDAHLTHLNVAIATELSTLYLVLYRKWSNNVDSCHDNKALSVVSQVLLSMPGALATPLYAITLAVLQSAQRSRSSLDGRCCGALITAIAHTLQNSQQEEEGGCVVKADVMAVLALNEMVRAHSPASWLHPLAHTSLTTILIRRVDTLLSHDPPQSVQSCLVTLLGLAQQREGAESLLMNGICHTLCISVLPEHKGELWLLAVKLTTSLLQSLGHQFLSHALDFVGVHQERLAASLDLYQTIKDLQCLQESEVVCRFFVTLTRYKSRWAYSSPSLVGSLLEALVHLSTGTVALLSKRAALKHIIKTMYSAGLLAPDVAPVTTVTRRKSIGRSVSLDQCVLDDSLLTSSPAFSQLQDGLVSILLSSLCSLRHFSPPLDAMLLDGVLDLVEYPPLFGLSLDPPILDNTMPPSLGTLTSCLSTVLALLNKVDPGSPTKSLSQCVGSGRRSRLVMLLEVGVFLTLSQSTRYLVDPCLDHRDKQQLKKELASELSTFLNSLLLNFSRKGAPSPSKGATPTHRTTPTRTLTDSGSSGRLSSLAFNEEQGLFRLSDTFIKQYLR
ncbi:nucleoporin NUP188-like isoform X2 [Halichondria panicea]|uniref:nucleoporin NUP188-like isoform X2 n=1 Tax=Halichondria panicea TaxID=6063 RepID=UPI00312B3265